MFSQYRLQPYKGKYTRHRCPKCAKERSFVRYVETHSGEYLSDHVGRCNREIECGYHYPPRQYFEENKSYTGQKKSKSPNYKIKTTCHSFSDFKKSLRKYVDNNFVIYLRDLFGDTITSDLIGKYFIGTSKHWPGSTIFWQIDITGKIMAGKIMLYDSSDGKRVKKPFPHVTWVHKALKLSNYHLDQCFFGEHLLREKDKPVAIVESERTASIASVYLPQFIWLACSGLNGLPEKKFLVLKNRKVCLFPDLSPIENGTGYGKVFNNWSKKAKDLSSIANITFSDLLERKATNEQRREGWDLADYFVNFDYKHFSSTSSRTDNGLIPFDKYVSQLKFIDGKLMVNDYPATWDADATYLDQKTKDFLSMCFKNPNVLNLQKRLQLTTG